MCSIFTLSITFSINLCVKFVTHAILVNFSFSTLKSNFKQNNYTMCINHTPSITFHTVLCIKFCYSCKPCNCFNFLLKIKQNKYAMCSNCNLIITFLTIPCETFHHPCKPCKCVIFLLKDFPGNILKPIGITPCRC